MIPNDILAKLAVAFIPRLFFLFLLLSLQSGHTPFVVKSIPLLCCIIAGSIIGSAFIRKMELNILEENLLEYHPFIAAIP